MSDNNLGRAYGEVVIGYDGSGAEKAAAGLDKAAESSAGLDKQTEKTNKSLGEGDKQFRASGTAAEGYRVRLRDVSSASADAEMRDKSYRQSLMSTMSTVTEIAQKHDQHRSSLGRLEHANNSARDSHRGLFAELSIGQKVTRGVSDLFSDLGGHIERVGRVSDGAVQKSSKLASSLGLLAKGVSVLGPEGRAAGAALEVLSKGASGGGDNFDRLGAAVSRSGEHLRNFVKELASFEVGFGKISGLALALPSIGGLAGLGGASALQGVVEVVEAVRQLSGLVGLLPAAVSGAAFSMGTLKIAFHGIGDAIGDMMADDPKKFLEDIANMAPAAAQSMLQIAQFRDQFKLAGGAIQESFFSKIAADIAPLIQTWLPAITSGMSQVAGIFGSFADELSKMMLTPQAMQVFELFMDNLTAGLQALQPAIAPLVNIFAKLVGEGSSFFAVIGGSISQALGQFDQFLGRAQQSGQLHEWIQTGINAFGHLMNTIEQAGTAFMRIMNVADKFGGGGLLGWLDKITAEFDKWTASAEGQNTLTEFFKTLRTATDAFIPMLKPLVEGFASIGEAFVKLGIGIAPGWQTFFDTFAVNMQQLGPQIQSMAPALNAFLNGMANAIGQLATQVGPELPRIFSTLADAFVKLLPQLGPLTEAFIRIVEQVGPQLPKLFQAVTDALNALVPLLPTIIELTREFVSAITFLVEIAPHALDFIKGFFEGIGDVSGIGIAIDKLSDLTKLIFGAFKDAPNEAEGWGKKIVGGLARGLADVGGLGLVGGALKTLAGLVPSFLKTSSPAERGPLNDTSPNQMGERIAGNFAAGMLAAQPAVESASASMAAAAAGGLSGARAALPGGLEGVGGALLPDWIASADTSVLDSYLRHEFDDNRGLKGLAKDLQNWTSAFQSGSNMLFQYTMQPLAQAMGMIPGLNQQRWTKMSSEQQQAELLKKAQQQGPSWGDLGIGTSGPQAATHSPVAGVGRQIGAGATVLDKQLAIIAKGKGLGLSDQEIQGILGIAQEESGFNNVGFMGFGPEAKANGVNIDSDPQAAIDLFFKNYMAGGLGASGPTKGQVVGPGGQILDQQQFIQFLWHRMQGAADPDYASKLAKAIKDQTNIYPELLAKMGGAGGMTWGGPGMPVVGVPAPNPDVVPSGPQRVGPDKKPIAPPPVLGSPAAPTAPVLGGAAGTPLVTPPAGQSPTGRPIYQGPHIDNTGGGVVPNVAYAEALIKQMFPGVSINNDWRTPDGYNEHSSGEAIDFSINPGGEMGVKTPEGQMLGTQLKDFLLANAARLGLQYAIWQETNWNPDGSTSPNKVGGITGGHYDHVHGRFLPGAAALGAGTSGLTLPSGAPLSQFVDPNTGKVYTGDQQALQTYLQGNPGLAGQINAARAPGAGDQQVLATLGSIDDTITQLKNQDAVGNQTTIQALQSTQSQIAASGGFQQGQSPAQMFSTIASGAGSVVGSFLQAMNSGFDALAGTQDIADRLVYGIRNTEDVNKIVDNVQKYITFAADIASAAGNIMNAIGGVAGAAGSAGGPAGGGAGAALSSAGQVAQLISSVLQGVNAAIDFSQMVYRIAGSYVGQMLSQLVAGPFGTPLMGDVGFLLNKNTGDLMSYSQDNPGNQNALPVPAFLKELYGYGGGNANPQVNQQLNVYAGPGQTTGQMMDEVVWMVNSGGGQGAMSPDNF